jgi:hypothetical protein
MDPNEPDAAIYQADFQNVENLILHQVLDHDNICTTVQQVVLPFPCIQNPVVTLLHVDEGLPGDIMTTVARVTFEGQDRVRMFWYRVHPLNGMQYVTL